MGLRDVDLVTIFTDQNLEPEAPFHGGMWAPSEPHSHEYFVPLNAPVYNMAVLGAVKTVPAADYSQWLMTLTSRIDALSSEVAALTTKLSQALERLQDQPAVRMLAIHGLGSEKYSLRKPVIVTVE